MLTTIFFPAMAIEDPNNLQYRRNSVYSILISHTEQVEFYRLIQGQFLNIPVSEKFNDHNLSVKIVSINNKQKITDQTVEDFITRNNIASHMVAKWFNRDPQTGQCDMTLVKNRGLYNASEFDKELASHTIRGTAMLQDAGEDLISNTYLIVNEIKYFDKNKASVIAGRVVTTVLMVAAAAFGVQLDNSFSDNLMELFEALKGFTVRITSRLYQLEWTDEIANTFYTQCYTEIPDNAKRNAFEQYRGDFKLKYLGQVVSRGNTTSYAGINEQQPWMMVRKALERALDENVVDLQKAIPAFRAKTPISSIGSFVKAPIGMKEGVEAGKKYEVLEAREHNGKLSYTRVGVVKPIPSLIWDNRFMAVEEKAPGATLGETSFVTVSGKDFHSGMLLREI
jgi:hypothetical protein